MAAARAKIEEIETRDLIALVGDQTVVKVDIRDIRKRQRDFSIHGSVLAPCGMIKFWVDPDSSGFKEVFWQDKKFVFHHALGWRSALTVAGLRQMGFEAAHLQEGFKTWAEVTGSVDPAAVWPLA